MTKTVLDSLIGNGLISPVIVVKPNGSCTPYWGSCWTNSVLYGNYEDYVIYDLVDFMESNFRVIADPDSRCLAGHSMGGSGSLTLALRFPERYRAIAAHSGYHDFQTGMTQVIPNVIEESPESSPPYTYDWENGMYTKLVFLTSGGLSPNLSAPDFVDFLLDESGTIVDSVWTLWETHNPAHMVKSMPLPVDLAIFTDCGMNDEWDGCYAAMTGITTHPYPQPSVILQPASPNPFATSTTISFSLPNAGQVRLEVYDISGRLVGMVVDEVLPTGEHVAVLDGARLSPGIYFYLLETADGRLAGRCVKLR